MILYHVHKFNQFDNLYQEGNSFVIGNEYNEFTKELMSTPTTSMANGSSCSFSTLFDHFAFDTLNKDEKILAYEDIKAYLFDSVINTREMLLEQKRLESFPNLPSRYKCIWLCDENGVGTWVYSLNCFDGFNVFEVEVNTEENDKLFKAEATLLPQFGESNFDILKKAEIYWSNGIKVPKEESVSEYLYTGNVRIRKRVI